MWGEGSSSPTHYDGSSPAHDTVSLHPCPSFFLLIWSLKPITIFHCMTAHPKIVSDCGLPRWSDAEYSLLFGNFLGILVGRWHFFLFSESFVDVVSKKIFLPFHRILGQPESRSKYVFSPLSWSNLQYSFLFRMYLYARGPQTTSRFGGSLGDLAGLSRLSLSRFITVK